MISKYSNNEKQWQYLLNRENKLLKLTDNAKRQTKSFLASPSSKQFIERPSAYRVKVCLFFNKNTQRNLFKILPLSMHFRRWSFIPELVIWNLHFQNMDFPQWLDATATIYRPRNDSLTCSPFEFFFIIKFYLMYLIIIKFFLY